MSRSPIRTAQASSGRPRRSRTTLRALTTVVLAAGTLASVAGPAQAHDAATCAKKFGASNVYDVDPLRVDTKHVDVGDLPHSFPGGGAPQADAVVCWLRGDVAVIGTMFYDSPQPEWGRAEVELDDVGGGPTLVSVLSNVPGQRLMTRAVYGDFPGRPGLDHLHLRVMYRTVALDSTGASRVVVHESDYYRGD